MNNTNIPVDEDFELVNTQAIPIAEELEVELDEDECVITKEVYNPNMANAMFYRVSPETANQIINNGATLQLTPAVIEDRDRIVSNAVNVNMVNVSPYTVTQSDVDVAKLNIVNILINTKILEWFETNKEESINVIMRNVDNCNKFLEYLNDLINGLVGAMSVVGIQEFLDSNQHLTKVYNAIVNIEADSSTFYILLLTLHSMYTCIWNMTDNEEYLEKSMYMITTIDSIIKGNSSQKQSDTAQPESIQQPDFVQKLCNTFGRIVKENEDIIRVA